jgi:hypothetical protein
VSTFFPFAADFLALLPYCLLRLCLRLSLSLSLGLCLCLIIFCLPFVFYLSSLSKQMYSNQREDNQRGAEVCMHLLQTFSRPKKSFHGTDCCSLAVTVGAGMDLHPIVLHAPLTTHHTLDDCLRSLRDSPPAATDLNLQASKELQAELAKYIATCSAAAAASKRAPRKRRQGKPGLFSLTKYDLVLVMGFLERVRCQAMFPSSRATKDVAAPSPPSSSPPVRVH